MTSGTDAVRVGSTRRALPESWSGVWHVCESRPIRNGAAPGYAADCAGCVAAKYEAQLAALRTERNLVMEEAMRAGADALRTSAMMAGRRGWPVASQEAERHAAVLERHLAALSPLPVSHPLTGTDLEEHTDNNASREAR